tara:strand:- start:35 stop:394 length:360 start_codon:yes stop_codon:yes gene_type:complete
MKPSPPKNAGHHALLEMQADGNTFGCAQERVLLADQRPTHLRQRHWNEMARIRCRERNPGFTPPLVRKHRRKQSSAGQYAFAGAKQRSHETRILPGAVTKHRAHHNLRVFMHHGTGFGD